MRLPFVDEQARPILFGALASGLILALVAGPVGEAVEAAAQIESGRERLARAHAAAARPPLPIPLAGASTDELLAIFRDRLKSLADTRAAVVERADLETDSERPTLPRLRASLRGTAEGLHGLLQALETQAPLLAFEEIELGIERPADVETGRPTVMRASLTARGIVIPPTTSGARP